MSLFGVITTDRGTDAVQWDTQNWVRQALASEILVSSLLDWVPLPPIPPRAENPDPGEDLVLF